MRVVVAEPPQPIVTWAEAKTHLRLDGEEEKALVESMLAAATANIDGPDGWLGRAIGSQTLDLVMEDFGCGPNGLQLPYRPVQSVESVQYIDIDGVLQTLVADRYELSLGSILRPVFGASWPSVRRQDDAVRIRFVAGYVPAVAGEPNHVPAPIRQAILLMVGDLYVHRETVSAEKPGAVQMSLTVERLLAPYRRWSL